MLRATWLCLSFALTLGSACSLLPSGAPQKFGDIYVSSPTVYTRERVINDRNDQATWLQNELNITDTVTFGFEGTAQRSHFAGLLAQGQISVERAPQIAQLLKQSPSSSTSPSTGAQSSGDPLQNFINTVSKPLAPSIPAPSNPTPSPVDVFRDRLAYRESVRAELIETQLDDRHDLRGNTLYRFTFDTTVHPARTNINAWAIVRVRFTPPDDLQSDQFYTQLHKEWRRYLEKHLSQLYTATVHMLKTNERDERYHDLAAYFDCELRSLQGEVKSLASCLPDSVPQEENSSSSLPSVPSAWVMPSFWPNRAMPHLSSPNILHKVFNKEEVTSPRTGRETHSKTGQQIVTLTSEVGILSAVDILRDLVISKSDKYYSAEDYREAMKAAGCSKLETETDHSKKDIAMCESNAVLHWLIKKYVVHLYGTVYNLKAYYDVTVKPQAPSIFILKETPKGFDNFKRRLRQKNQDSLIYSYAVTPKDSVQRISDATSGREAREFLGGLSALTGTIDLKAMLGSINQSDAIFNAIRREPLVVGFGNIDGTWPEPPAIPMRSQIGWVIGPKFKVTSPKENQVSLSFAQVTIQNALSASVSLPAWWKGVTVQVNRCWSPRDVPDDVWSKPAPAPENPCRDEFPAVEQPFKIDLPGDVSALDDILLIGAKRRPIVDTTVSQEQEPRQLTVSKANSLLIPGRNLWRATMVTVGPWKSDRIVVLPNMEGIIAQFDPVNTATWAKTKDGATEPVYVWTSEGVADAGAVIVVADAEAVLEISVPQRHYIVGTDMAVTINETTLPKAYAGMDLVIRGNGGPSTGWGPGSKAQLKGNTLSASFSLSPNPCGSPAGCPNGDLLDVGVALKLTPDGNPKYFTAKEHPVIYLNSQDAKARLKKSDGTMGDVALPSLPATARITVQYPVNAKLAYKGFDPQSAKLKAKGPDGAAPITLDTPSCSASDNRQTTCTYRVSGAVGRATTYSLEIEGTGDNPGVNDKLMIGQ